MWLRDEESEPLDYAAELGRRPPARLVLADRQTERAGVSPGGPVTEGMRTDTQTDTLDGPAGLVGPLPTGRDRDEHSYGEGIARQGEHLDATRSPYLNRSLGASSGRSETPLTAVANRTFRSIAPQTPSLSRLYSRSATAARSSVRCNDRMGVAPASGAGSAQAGTVRPRSAYTASSASLSSVR